MLVPTFSALALSWALASDARPVDDRPHRPHRPEEQLRTIEPTESELAQFQLTPERDYLHESDSAPAFRVFGVGMFAASAADLITTERGLSQGFAEGNPAASQRGLRIATHVVGTMAVYYTTEKLQRTGKTKTALLLRISLMAAYSYAAIHNARLIGASP